MNISIGTPAFNIVAIADTGSDLIWTQCKPCSQCFKQNATLFDPSESSTYKTFSCSASQCENLEGNSCSSNKSCQYSVSYGDNSFSNGDLAADTLTLASTTGRPTAVPKTVIGCGHNNDGTFDEKTSGIIGLGGGAVSLISQLGISIAGKFSYCLLPISKTGESSKINFDDGNIIIDSGTTLTLFPEDFYSELELAVSSKINATKVDALEGLSLCYDARTEFAVPDITIHFTDADVKLQPLNTFVLVSDRVACFDFNSFQDFSIYGNLAQMNFLVGYDTYKQTVSFMPTDCSKN
ncbi:hypothetical protein CRYUN_Cryun05aG0051000 [Craigia yunnanensis]